MRIAVAALLYSAIVFAVGLTLGPIRVLWLEPRLGPVAAELCEAPFLVAAMILAAWWVPTRLKLCRDPLRLGLVGLGAVAVQQGADLAVGAYLRGITPAEQFAHFATVPGLIYAGLLAAFAAMPLLVNRGIRSASPEA